MSVPPQPPQNLPRPLALYVDVDYGESFTMYQSDGITPVDLTGALVYSSMLLIGGDSPVAFTTTIPTPLSGIFAISMPRATLTAGLVGNYTYDVKIKWPVGTVDFMWGGPATVATTVTVVA
jgi:hypothetical protein